MGFKATLNFRRFKVALNPTNRIGILKRSRSFVPFETLLCIWNALVQPYFDYCSVVWGNCNESLYIKLQNYRIALHVSWPLLQMLPMRMISLLDLAGKNLIFNWNEKQPVWSINRWMVSPWLSEINRYWSKCGHISSQELWGQTSRPNFLKKK